MPEYDTRRAFLLDAIPLVYTSADLTPRAPALLDEGPREPRVLGGHQHAWNPATLRCLACGWSYYAVLARLKAVQP